MCSAAGRWPGHRADRLGAAPLEVPPRGHVLGIVLGLRIGIVLGLAQSAAPPAQGCPPAQPSPAPIDRAGVRSPQDLPPSGDNASI